MKQKAKWGLFEKLLAAALVLCLAAAGVFLWLFSREAHEYTTASDDYDTVREQYLGTIVPDTLPPDPTAAPAALTTPEGSGAETVAPTPSPTLALEQEADEDSLELMVILHNEAVAVSRNGATTTPMPTPAPTMDARGAGADGAAATAGGSDGVAATGGSDGAGGSDGTTAAVGGSDGATAAVGGSDGATAAGGSDWATAAGGSDGAASTVGSDGATATAGSDGATAAVGSDGAASTVGSDGATAAVGGSDGTTAAVGSDGAAAAAGSDGAAAAAVGSDGATAVGGSDGAAAAAGSDGATAAAGGSDGATLMAGGSDGATATAGSDGAATTVGSDGSASTAAEATSSPTAPPTPEPPRVGRSVTEKVRYSADFIGLQQTNEDVCAWLLQENTAISYPVVQGYNNTIYLDYLYTGLKSQAGSIFLDCGNSRYFTDMVSYLYGHNRKDGAMFATLPEYMNQSYADEHPSFYLLTPYMDYRLDVFACVRASVDEKDEWHTKFFDGKRAFDSFVSQVQRQSPIRTAVTPQWGDQLLALCTCTNEVHEERYVVYTRMSPIQYETDESVSIIHRELDTADTLTHTINVPGVGEMLYYATNDPLWARMCYEGVGGTGRRMGSGGTGPCAMAIITAHMLDSQYLWWLNYYSGREEGHTFCTCSVNQYFCNRRHAQYRLQTPEEFLRYLPVAMASFASGNNQWHENSRKSGTGTEATFMKRVCDIFGLYFEANRERDAVLEMLGRGGMVVAVCGYDSSGSRHYVVLASMDDTYIYILDPYYVEEYPENALSGVELMEPGLLRVKIEDWDLLRTGACYLIKQWPY